MRFNMQGKDTFYHTNGKYHILHSSMQEEIVLEYTNGKCYFYTL